jgi:hypothetical protein
MPALVGVGPGGNPIIHYISLTDRDVILAKGDVTTANADSGNYDAVFGVPVAGQVIEFTRGWTAVDATVRGRTYLFVNTHLEVQGGVIPPSSIQAEQANELIALLADELLPILLVGDFNSSEDDPIGQPYSVLTDAGYVDSWDQSWVDLGVGYSCCQDSDLLNAASVLDERVDLIFVRNDQGHWPVTSFNTWFATVLGDLPEDKTPSGLWPSDHGGVMAKLKLSACGLGFELALILPPLMMLRRRQR